MISFVYTNEVVFCLTLTLYLVSAFIGIVSFAMSIQYKLKLHYSLPPLLISSFNVIIFGFLTDAIRIRYKGVDPNTLTNSLCFMPLWSVLLIGILLFIFIVIWLILIIKKRLSSITAMSVKEATQALSSGLCFYDETGRVLLLNSKIDEECQEITGSPLNDGISFWDNLINEKVLDGIKITKYGETVISEKKQGNAISYKRIIHNIDGKIVFELSGSNITRELALKKELEEKNIVLESMNKRLRKYGEIVSEVTKERETLAARIKVHSNLGSLILRTKKALSQDDLNEKELITSWNDILTIIFQDEETDKLKDVYATAKTIGVKILIDGTFSNKNTKQEQIFLDALFECTVNTARHANGDKVFVKIKEDESFTYIEFTNNGIPPKEEIKEGGGLTSIRMSVDSVNGQMKIQSLPMFVLSIKIPKEKLI